VNLNSLLASFYKSCESCSSIPSVLARTAQPRFSPVFFSFFKVLTYLICGFFYLSLCSSLNFCSYGERYRAIFSSLLNLMLPFFCSSTKDVLFLWWLLDVRAIELSRIRELSILFLSRCELSRIRELSILFLSRCELLFLFLVAL